MKYRIKDLQFENRYFADGHIFENKREVCEHLIDYHSIDCDISIEQKLLDENKIDKCWEALTGFGWKLEKV